MGYFDNQGLPATKATWANPTVTPESQRANGGWYYNPASGYVDRWWSGGTTGSGSTSSTSSSLSSPSPASAYDYRGILTAQTSARQAENARLKAEQDAVLGAYRNAVGSQTPLDQAYRDYANELGIPGLNEQLTTARSEVSNVKGLLDNLEADITSRTNEQLLSESQRRRLLAYEETPLRTQLGNLLEGQEVASGQLSQAYTQAGQQMLYLSAEQNRQIAPYLTEIEAFSDRAAREYTGFNMDQQNSLDVLLAQIARDQQVNDMVWQRTSELAEKELDFQRSKELLKYEASLKITGDSASYPSADEWASILGSGGNVSGLTLNSTGSVNTTTPVDNSLWDNIMNSIWGTPPPVSQPLDLSGYDFSNLNLNF